MCRSAAPPSVQHVCVSPSLTGSDLLRACEVPVPDMADGAGGQLGALRAVLHLHRAVQRSRVQERYCKLLFLGLFFFLAADYTNTTHDYKKIKRLNVESLFCFLFSPSVINTGKASSMALPAAVCATKELST